MQQKFPLEGITVVSIEHAIAAPFCTRQLAELGARVIKVERPDGGDFARKYDARVNGQSSHFVWVNRSKESLCLDLKSPGGIEVLFRLFQKADVFVQNLGPGAADRLGLSYAQLKERFPRLIVCGISGYGNTGSYAQKKAYDLMIQSESGFLSTTGDGTAEGMAKAGCSISDIAAGMYAYSNILAALLQRYNTGVGREIDISMLECMVEWMSFPLYYSFDGSDLPIPNGASHSSICPYGPFTTKDGDTIVAGVQNEREWNRFCNAVLKRPSLATDTRFHTALARNDNKKELVRLIGAILAELSTAEFEERLVAAQIACSRVNNMHDVWQHEQLRDRQRWVDVESPKGRLPALLPPGVNAANECKMGAVPALGQHTQSILDELGISTSAVDMPDRREPT